MDIRKTSLFVGSLMASLAAPVFASLEGTYSGNFVTGQSVGAYSYINDATSAKRIDGDADYTQYAGGNFIFAMDNTNTVSFNVNDAGNDGLGAGDTIDLDIQVDLLEFDGTLNESNSLTDVVATLSLQGTLTVGGSFSPSFTHGIYNIDASGPGTGLGYQIEVTRQFSTYSVGDRFTGDAFFQSGDLAAPFNGIGYDSETGTLSFAIWGDSANKAGDTGKFEDGSGLVDHRLGFDLVIEAHHMPEASSVIVWSLLTFLGISHLRRKGGA
jgi:hypothetical protein